MDPGGEGLEATADGGVVNGVAEANAQAADQFGIYLLPHMEALLMVRCEGPHELITGFFGEGAGGFNEKGVFMKFPLHRFSQKAQKPTLFGGGPFAEYGVQSFGKPTRRRIIRIDKDTGKTSD